MDVEVETVNQVSDELVIAVQRLLPQLSTSAPPLDAGKLSQVIQHQAVTLLVARSRGTIVGMLTLVMFPLPSGQRARIEDVVVDEAARGHGAGAALTTAALRLAHQQGARTIDLTSRASRVAANRLYERLGFALRDSKVYRYRGQAPAP
jgi:ribosomal protein S18 acetylase RimI-like enzyme